MTCDHEPDSPFRPLIRTQADLEATWRRLMEPLGFSRHSVWILMIDADDRPVPQIIEIDDAHHLPPDLEAEGFGPFARHLLDDVVPGGRLAMLRTRPGSGGPDADDLGWSRILLAGCRSAGVPTDVVHLATDVDLLPLPLDVLGAA
ncbi:hypothetical protein [uncultured Nocardioides sp.]|uniref:hypothetical protein n=1 Tax=uncultured Nocardioides sp. TaxID=198441 RepID=UPI00262F65B3|nr:hypothetical protein [uncultured Nocardioides sp.]